ncbi:hypothetical protein Godav_003482 [Gossypium davidsonii]|uniref:Uncharacterized protein n=2 Tax=Gossypium TaxID=3633 RepID=A0A7J8SJC5_GOSDV|nr:hypothetical protein [Gossypium davidsonii]MBA0693503.1 hypothetical protein [Gossypium aridum]
MCFFQWHKRMETKWHLPWRLQV